MSRKAIVHLRLRSSIFVIAAMEIAHIQQIFIASNEGAT